VLIAIASSIFVLCGCGSDFGGTPAGAIVGRSNAYNYSPSAMQTGNLQQFWWCGTGINPNDKKQHSDTILYESMDLTTNKKSKPVVVLAETEGSWDALFTCNPRVIRGRFQNPLGDGQSFTYEMFYVGSTSGLNNSIGAAFSKDGVSWTKYPEPVIYSTSVTGYGVGQPVAYNADGGSSITLFYEDNTPSIHHVQAVSSDGIHFTVQGTLTAAGLDPAIGQPSWGDMGYDIATGYWYAAFQLPNRPPSTTGDIPELGQYGFQLYRIPGSSLLTGATPWELVKTIDTNLTGYEANFLPSLLHDQYGNINVGSYPTLELFVSTSLPQPAWDASPATAGKTGDIFKWAIAVSTYLPSQGTLTLSRYINDSTYETTTGWTDPDGSFVLDTTLGHLYGAPKSGATQAIYACKAGSKGYFASLDSACEGQRILGLEGYGFTKPPSGVATVALYRCTSTKYGSFLSQDAACEGNGAGTLLAYALP
jgi:hypothetical protein